MKAGPIIAAAALDGVVFDLDGTLYRQAPVRRGMALRVAAHLARHPGAGWRALRFVKAYRLAQETLRAGEHPRDAREQLAWACRQTGADPEWAALVIAEWMERRPLDLVRRHVREGAAAFLQAARRRGVRLAVFSDYPAEAKLDAMGLRPFFDVVRCAQDPDIVAFKPHPHGLRRTLEALGVEPGRALHVGDRPAIDDAAARAAGMRAALLGSRRAGADPACLCVGSFDELALQLGWE